MKKSSLWISLIAIVLVLLLASEVRSLLEKKRPEETTKESNEAMTETTTEFDEIYESIWFDADIGRFVLPEEEKTKACGEIELPEEVLSLATTDNLLDILFDYPYLVVPYSSNNEQEEFESLCFYFNGAKELMTRVDLASVVISYLEEKELVYDKEDFLSMPRGVLLEKIAAQPELLKQLDEDGVHRLLNAIDLHWEDMLDYYGSSDQERNLTMFERCFEKSGGRTWFYQNHWALTNDEEGFQLTVIEGAKN
ncbi:MAG: hypothetical protein IJ744_02135 [Lachnospiraceae bacterium]|nr:hypothetical protein [Lachnospiraceae bacterium]